MSEASLLQYRSDQGSAVGSVLFLVYAHSIPLLLASHGVDGYFRADVCQFCLLIANINGTKTKVLALLFDMKTWMRERKLKPYESNTETILIKGNLRTKVTREFVKLSC